ncbi:hypothetical protein AYO38_00395 [bacterium SCGC AG-212-C10]|nr:hypothetical protein AYO38_00395 [bacterium SCGC AG-212-C10]
MPRPDALAGDATKMPSATARTPRRQAFHHREHHVDTDYGYIKRDLLVMVGVSVVTIGFIVGMSFVL